MPMPSLIGGQLIWYWRARANEGHFTLQHIEELGKFIETGSAQYFAHTRNSFIVGEFIDAFAGLFWGCSARLTRNQARDKILMRFVVVVHEHRTKFEKCESLTVAPYPLLEIENRAPGGEVDGEGDDEKHRGQQNQHDRTSGEIDRSFDDEHRSLTLVVAREV